MSHLRFAFHERPAATVSAAVTVRDGRVSEASIAVGSVGVVPVLVPGAEALVDQPPEALEQATLEMLGRAGAEASEPVTDANGSDDYKGALVQTLVARAAVEAAARAAERAEAQA